MAYVAAKSFTFYGRFFRKGQEFKTDKVKDETVEKLVKSGRITQSNEVETKVETETESVELETETVESEDDTPGRDWTVTGGYSQ